MKKIIIVLALALTGCQVTNPKYKDSEVLKKLYAFDGFWWVTKEFKACPGLSLSSCVEIWISRDGVTARGDGDSLASAYDDLIKNATGNLEIK